MKTIHAIIVDTDTSSISSLSNLLQKDCPEVDIVATANTVNDAEYLIHEHQPNLVFIDLEMHTGNKFQLFDNLQPHHFHIIFTSTEPECFCEALNYNAIHFLSKPFSSTELKHAINKAIYTLENNHTLATILLEANKMNADIQASKHLYTHTATGMIAILIASIMYIIIENENATIYLSDGSKYFDTNTLSFFEEVLMNYRFIRIHNCTLVNQDYIHKYIKGRGGSVILFDKTELTVSDHGKKELMAHLTNRRLDLHKHS